MTHRDLSDLGNRRRLKFLSLYRNRIVLILVISLLPTIVLLVISYFQAIAYAKANLEMIIDTATSETNRLLEDADRLLHRIKVDIEPTERQTAVNTLQRLIYTDFRFREAGIFNADGFLLLTSLGVVEPPIPISPTKRSFDPSNPNLQILGSGRTQILQEQSIALALQGPDGVGGVYLLVDPVILTYFLEAIPNLDLGPNGFVVFMTDDGRILNTVGSPPQESSSSLHERSSNQIRVDRITNNGAITVVGEINREWVLRYWRQELMLGVPFAALISGVLIYLFLRQVRQVNTLDYELKLGLDHNVFEVHYQPIVDLETRQCTGAEALIRWLHPQRGTIYPGLFIPIAEQTGFIIPMTEWLIEKVIQDQIILQEKFKRLYVSVNLSPIQLNTGNVEQLIQSLKAAHDDSNVTIIFEITENRLAEDRGSTAQDSMARLKVWGTRFAIDDFGTGYCNISYLQKFDIDYLKLDRLFVQGLYRDNNTAQIVDSLIDLGKKLGLTLIAEGIETEMQCQYLRERGVRYGQGWLFSRPLPFSDFERFLQTQEAK